MRWKREQAKLSASAAPPAPAPAAPAAPAAAGGGGGGSGDAGAFAEPPEGLTKMEIIRWRREQKAKLAAA